MLTFTNHHLTAEHINDEHGPAIMLTQQEGLEDPETIVVHPWQLVAACQHLGLNNSDPQAEKTIATLTRRLLALRDRIESLSEWMAKHSDHKHADLSYETTQLNAMADLAIEWCLDFDEPEAVETFSPQWTVNCQNPVMHGAPRSTTKQAELL